jgi:Fe-S oxidoreductase
MPGDVPVVVDSEGCGADEDYGRPLGTDDAAAFAARVRGFSEWLVGQARLPIHPMGPVVVVHDPCHLRQVQHAANLVRYWPGGQLAIRISATPTECAPITTSPRSKRRARNGTSACVAAT